MEALNATVQEANGVEHATGLENAEAILTELQDRVPEEARTGIGTALENVPEARNRFLTDETPGEDDRRSDDTERGV